MTKSILCAAAAAMLFIPLTSCSDDDPKMPSGSVSEQAAVKDVPEIPVVNQMGDPTKSKNGLYYVFNFDNGEKLSISVIGYKKNTSDRELSYAGEVNRIDGDVKDAVIPANVVVPMTKQDGSTVNITIPVTGYNPQYNGLDNDIRNIYIPATCAYTLSVDSQTGVGTFNAMPASTFTGNLTNANNLENIYIQSNADMPFCSINGAIYTADMKTFVSCPAGRKDYFAIAQGTETVASLAFQMCKKLTSITFPASVTSIERNAIMFDFKILVLNMLGMTPPQAPADAFGYYVHNATVRVPIGCETTYNNVAGFAACKKVEGYF